MSWGAGQFVDLQLVSAGIAERQLDEGFLAIDYELTSVAPPDWAKYFERAFRKFVRSERVQGKTITILVERGAMLAEDQLDALKAQIEAAVDNANTAFRGHVQRMQQRETEEQRKKAEAEQATQRISEILKRQFKKE